MYYTVLHQKFLGLRPRLYNTNSFVMTNYERPTESDHIILAQFPFKPSPNLKSIMFFFTEPHLGVQASETVYLRPCKLSKCWNFESGRNPKDYRTYRKQNMQICTEVVIVRSLSIFQDPGRRCHAMLTL